MKIADAADRQGMEKLPRLVRDLAAELGKQIELEMKGAETELDRQVLDMIKEPLAHMVRNAGDHGTEGANVLRRSSGTLRKVIMPRSLELEHQGPAPARFGDRVPGPAGARPESWSPSENRAFALVRRDQVEALELEDVAPAAGHLAVGDAVDAGRNRRRSVRGIVPRLKMP